MRLRNLLPCRDHSGMYKVDHISIPTSPIIHWFESHPTNQPPITLISLHNRVWKWPLLLAASSTHHLLGFYVGFLFYRNRVKGRCIDFIVIPLLYLFVFTFFPLIDIYQSVPTSLYLGSPVFTCARDDGRTGHYEFMRYICWELFFAWLSLSSACWLLMLIF